MSKIYLIDDQPIANFITKKLLELEGSEDNIRDFTDPVEAFKAVCEDEEALIFLDLNMPVMNGWEFLEKLKTCEHNHRIIILSSSTNKIDIERAKDYPSVIKYMIKPLSKLKFSEITGFLKKVG